LDLPRGIFLWAEAFLAKVQQSVLFTVTGEESCNGAGIEFVDCICECYWPIIGQLSGIFFFVQEDGFTVFPLCWDFSLLATVMKE
jgi:hypothetical protein